MRYKNFTLTHSLILLLLLFMVSCNSETTTQNQSGNVLKPTDYFKTLLIIGDDRSGSTNDIRKLDAKEYKTLISAIAKKGGGTVAVCLIGNPLPQSKEPFILELDPLEKITPYDPKSTDLTLTQKGAIKAKNDKIIAGNKKILTAIDGKINNFITGSIAPNIIGYKPSGQDHTDLDDALRRINTMVNESRFNNYQKIIIAIFSDGKNQPQAPVIPITSKIIKGNATVYLVGWETAINCFEVKSIDRLGEKTSLIDNIINLKK